MSRPVFESFGPLGRRPELIPQLSCPPMDKLGGSWRVDDWQLTRGNANTSRGTAVQPKLERGDAFFSFSTLQLSCGVWGLHITSVGPKPSRTLVALDLHRKIRHIIPMIDMGKENWMCWHESLAPIHSPYLPFLPLPGVHVAKSWEGSGASLHPQVLDPARPCQYRFQSSQARLQEPRQRRLSVTRRRSWFTAYE